MDKEHSTSILVIIATLNEEDGIEPTIAELRETLDEGELLVVDGNSKDRTVEIAKDKNARVLFQEGKGKGDAIGFAIRNTGSDFDYVILIDADFTYPAGYLPDMIKILEDNPEVGMVIGNRFNHSFELGSMKSPFYAGNRFLALCQYLFNGVSLRDPLTGLRVVRWKILRNWKPRSKGFDIEAEMNHRVENQGYKIVEIPIQYRNRLGEKKLKLRHGFLILRRIILESLSYSKT